MFSWPSLRLTPWWLHFVHYLFVTLSSPRKALLAISIISGLQLTERRLLPLIQVAAWTCTWTSTPAFVNHFDFKQRVAAVEGKLNLLGSCLSVLLSVMSCICHCCWLWASWISLENHPWVCRTLPRSTCLIPCSQCLWSTQRILFLRLKQHGSLLTVWLSL